MESDIEFLKVRRRRLPAECSADYLLPDYLGEVKRVLFANATVDDLTTYEGDEDLGVGGSVLIKVVYLDTEDKLSHLDFTADVDSSVKWDKEMTESVSVECEVEKLSLRLMGPRKFSAKVQLTLGVEESVLTAHSVEGDGMEGNEPECDTVRIRVAEFSKYTCEDITLNEELSFLEGAIEDEVSVLVYDMSVADATTEDKGVISGNLLCRALVKVGEEYPTVMTKTVPFEGIIRDYTSDGEILTQTIIDIRDTFVKTVGSDDGVRIEMGCRLQPKLLCHGNRECELVKDCYLKEYESLAEYGSLDYVCVDNGESGRVDLELSIDAEELGIGNIREVIYSSLEVKGEDISADGKTLAIVGKIRASGIACVINEENLPSYCALKCDMPFKANVNYNCHNSGNSELDCSLALCDASLYTDGGKLCMSGKLLYSALSSVQKSQEVLTALFRSEEQIHREESVVTVYYPTSGESLFSVAKTFHTSVLKLAKDNSITEEVFADKSGSLLGHGVRRLIVK